MCSKRQGQASDAMKVVTVAGARPQFIKAAAVSRVLRQAHTEMLDALGRLPMPVVLPPHHRTRARLAQPPPPLFGDGHANEEIVAHLQEA